jgi:hypothetical protein
VKGGEQWALKVLVDKLYANKRESQLDVTVRQEARPLLDNLRVMVREHDVAEA